MSDSELRLHSCVYAIGAGDYTGYGIVGLFATVEEAKREGEAWIRKVEYDSTVEIECYVIGQMEATEPDPTGEWPDERSYGRASKVVSKWKWDGKPNPDSNWEYRGVEGHWEDREGELP